MRLAFTIIYNGLHHLQHREWFRFMVDNFDYWAIVEGHSRNNGSTRWCNKLHIAPRSEDGTHEFLLELAAKHPHVLYESPGRYFMSKDHQVNRAIEMLKTRAQSGYLWEVDADEHWTREKLEAAEAFAKETPGIGFCFQFNHLCGPGLIAKGEWGEGCLNRLWKWNGQPFRSHEPALLMGQRHAVFVPEIKFDHYSYYFEQDVRFKSQYYKGHELVYDKWLALQESKEFPQHISALFGLHTKIGKSKSFIHEIRN